VTRTRPEGMRCLISLRRNDVDARFPGLLDAIMAHGRSGRSADSRAAAS